MNSQSDEGLTSDASLTSPPPAPSSAHADITVEDTPPAVAPVVRPAENAHFNGTEMTKDSSGNVLEQLGSGGPRKFVFQCAEGDCGFSSGHRDRFVTHLRCLHHIRVDERVLDFNDWAAFISWKENLERETHASFVRVSSSDEKYISLFLRNDDEAFISTRFLWEIY